MEKDTDVFDDYREATSAKFRLKRGERVTAVTGVVLTTRFGLAVATDAIPPGKGMKPGDRFDVL